MVFGGAGHQPEGERLALRVDALVRERLFGGSGAVGELPPLTLLCAPAGYGKTVAAMHRSEALEKSGLRVRWATRHANSAGTPEALWRGMVEELGETESDAGYERLERIVRAIEQPTVIIVDDYHVVTDNASDLALIRLLLLNEKLSLIVLSRYFAALDGPLVSSRVETVRITEADLKFTPEETSQLAEASGIVRDDLVAKLHEYCDGWPVAVAWVLRQLRPETRVSEMVALAASTAQRMFGQMDDESARRVMLATAAGDYATPARIAELVELSEQECLRAVVELEALGLVRRVWYSDGLHVAGHPGLRHAFEPQAVAVFGADELRRWQVRNAVSLGSVGVEVQAAFKRLLECEAYAEAQALLTSNLQQILNRRDEVVHQFRGIPDDQLFKYSELIAGRLLLEQSDPRSDPARVKHLFEVLKQRVNEDLSEASAGRSIASEIVAVSSLSAAERMRGNAESLALARETQRSIEANRGNALKPIERTLPFIHAVAAFGGLANGDYELGERGFRSCLESAEALGDVDEHLRALHGLAGVAAAAGRVNDAWEYLERAKAHIERTGATPPQLAWMNGEIGRAMIAVERHDEAMFEEAAARIRPVLDRAELWPFFLIAENSIERLARGYPDAFKLMEQRYAEVGSIFVTVPNMRLALNAGIATMHMLAGDYDSARKQLEGAPLTHPRVAIAVARLRLLRGDYPEAVRIVRAVHEAEGAYPRYRCDALLVHAAAAWRGSDSETAVELAARASDEMQRNGLWSALALLPYSLVSELASALRARGDGWFEGAVAEIPEHARFEPFEQLSQAELRIVGALPECETTSEIARTLFLSPNTVKSHLKNVYRKLRVSRRSEAIERAQQLGLLARD